MLLRAIASASAALALLSAPIMAQEVTDIERKPALLVKPAPWTPKTIHRSQLRPQLKPALATVSAEADDDVYVPPVQAAAAPIPVSAPVALASAAQPVQMAAVRPAVQVTETGMSAASIEDFKGKFLGAGVEVSLAPSPTEPPRRMSQVEITGDANEFTVKWATMRVGANFKPETVKSSQQELTFRPTGTPGLYAAIVAEGSGQPQNATAELSGRTMIVTVNNPLPSGQASIQRYERTLTDRGMDVVFTRTEGGQLIRQVNLSLSRSGKTIWQGL
jgi:hypothetical protein